MEIERKFLTPAFPDFAKECPYQHISQAYLSLKPTIRIRQQSDLYYLTVKGSGAMTREEFEMEITKEEYEHLKTKIDYSFIEKTRYFIPLENGLEAELDIYEGVLQGLITTEVEFSNVESAEKYIPPQWMGKDITYDNRYKNVILAKNGIPLP